MKFINSLLKNKKYVIALYVLFAVAAGTQAILLGGKIYIEGGKEYTHYNNYKIFKSSYFHLVEGKDLYAHYLDEHFDLYKYSPTFALFMGALAYFPDFIGLNLWNIINALCLLLGVYMLPKLGLRQKGLILVVCIIELMTSMQNAQSNALIVGLIILAFALLEKEKYLYAVLLIVFSVYIKIFGLVAFALCVFYPKKWKLALYSILWFVVLALLPLLVVDISQLKFLYESWGNVLSNDQAVSYGLSVMGWLHTWFGFEGNKMIIVLIGVVLFCLPLIKFKEYKNYQFRLFALSSVLLWIVIFNHRAESPTFIIAMLGAAIWYYSQERKTENLVLFILAFVLTSLSPTDIFPRALRKAYIIPYVLKAVPCILIWGKLIYEMMFNKVELRNSEKF